jgi:hypothetical protein
MFAMKLTVFLAIFVGASLAGVLAQEPPPAAAGTVAGNWINVAPADQGFTILMPGKATEQSQPVGSDARVENHLLTLDTSLAGYVVSYVQFPDEVTDPVAIKELLDRGRDGGVQSSNGQLKSEKEITIKGFSGREWVMTLPGNLTARARAYWVKRRLYQIVFVVKEEATTTPAERKLRQDAESKFFESFTLSDEIK